MNTNFWTSLPKPIIALAPMAGVTDAAFRRICKEFGADVIYTEFVSAIALVHESSKTKNMIQFHNSEHPLVVQIFGNNPEHFFKASKILEEMGFDGIDINFGCPAYKVVKTGGGVSLMRNLDLCYELVQACCEAVKIPISIKIRSSINCVADQCEIDYATQHLGAQFIASEQKNTSAITALDLIEKIKPLPVAAIMIHGRTYEKPFDGKPDMNMITEVKRRFSGITLGNGGVFSPEDAEEMLETTQCDGIGLGRGTHGNPWLFTQIQEYLQTGTYTPISWEEKKTIMLRHARYALETKGPHGLVELRKHLLWYAKGIPNSKHLKQAFCQVKNIHEVESILSAFTPSV